MVLSLTCAVQNYDWGITGDSEVASLGERNTGTSVTSNDETDFPTTSRKPAYAPMV